MRISNRKELEKIKIEFAELIKIDVDEIYNDRYRFLQDLILKGDYSEALSNCNLKKKLSCELANDIIVDNYEDRILELINRTPELAVLIRDKYLQCVPHE